MEPQPEINEQIRETAKDIANKTALSLKANQPLFLIVYYDHETDKLALQESIRQSLKEKKITTRPFDPRGNQEHTTGKLYPLLAHASREKNLCIISGLPLNKKKLEPDNAFIHYLNIFRDRIAKERIRMLLFLHASNAEQFMGTAGDLWDFRHGTYWLERKKEELPKIHWDDFEKQVHGLNDLDRDEILKHISNVQPLIDNTEESDEKARLLVDLANWLRRRHAYPLAIKTAYQAVDFTKGKRNSLRAEIELELGYCLRLNSDLPEALEHYKRSLKISKEIGDKAGEAATLNNISQIFKTRGDYDTALKYLERNLEIWQGIGDKAGEGTTLNNISQIYHAKGDYSTALKHLKLSLKIRREIRDKTGEGRTLNNISQIYQARGDHDTALKYLELSLEIIRKIGDKAGEGATLNNISQIYHAKGDYDTTLKYLEQSLEITREIGDKAGEGVTLNNISQIYDARGDYDTALKYLQQSLEIRQGIGDKAGEAVTCHNLAMEWERRKNIRKAIHYLKKAVEIKEQTEHPDFLKDKEYLDKLIQNKQNNDKF